MSAEESTRHLTGPKEADKIDLNGPKETESSGEQAVLKFDNMDLKPELLRGIYAYGFERPSAIQQQAIIPVIKGHDVIVQAQSGAGKATAISISILQQLDMSVKGIQALVLAPNHELAKQIQKVLIALGGYMNIECYTCIGSTKIREEIANLKLKEVVHVVVGTPGRVLDMINRRVLRTDSIKIFCLDEADEMLSRGFKDQVYDIFQRLPQGTQVVLLSATMPANEVTEKLMRDPVHALVECVEATPKGIKQFHIAIEKEERKFKSLCDLLETVDTITQAVIFCNTKRKANWLAEKMCALQLRAFAIHGGVDQKQREVLMKDFRSGVSRVLIATDLLAHGIDGQQVALVINYDFPTTRETYIHRISSFGGKGVAIGFATTKEMSMLRGIGEFCNVRIDQMPINIADFIPQNGAQ
ncbi:ATP-dependent RNA helicase eIF4A [Coprinopsis sp. MPI-PUGE-AT-0042]|nr:ATP-dependent RNA helicase eIF4A [Coprinopsis sp. MPI-PUGE-AT-0042]